VTYEDLCYALLMLKRKLILLVLVFIFGFVGTFPFTGRMINTITGTVLPEGATVIYLSPAEVMLLKFKIALIAGVLLTVPLGGYFTYSAIKYRFDLRKDIRNISTSHISILFIGLIALILFLLGAGYAYFLMLPFFIQYLFQNAASAGVVATYSIAEFISFVALTTIIFGFVFEFPLIVIILVRSGLVDRNTLIYYRYHAYIGLLVLSAVITPPDVISQIIIAGPLIVFFEISLLLAKFIIGPKR
jgi:sec-independent protein translocase protein TatC